MLALQTLSYFPTQSPPKFRHLSQPATSLCMPSSEPSAASPFNHALTSSFTSSFLLNRLPFNIPSAWGQVCTKCWMLKNFPVKLLKHCLRSGSSEWACERSLLSGRPRYRGPVAGLPCQNAATAARFVAASKWSAPAVGTGVQE